MLLLVVCQLSPADAGGGIIFSPDLSMQLAAFMFVLILLFTLAWEEGTDALEVMLMEQPHFLAMLSKIYRELMILGFITGLLTSGARGAERPLGRIRPTLR